MICFYIGLYLKNSGFDYRAVITVSNFDSIIRATKRIKEHNRKQYTEKSGGQGILF